MCADDAVPQKRKICPQGCTPEYASPQQLRARQSLLEYGWEDDTSSQSSSQQDMPSVPVRAKVLKGLSVLWRKMRRVPNLEQDTAEEDDESMIDGPKADVFAAGVVLCEMVSFWVGNSLIDVCRCCPPFG